MKTWAGARRELVRAGLTFREHVTVRAGEAEQMTRDAVLTGVGVVIAVGGDGTLSELIRGYLDSDGRAINPEASVGLLPSGTGSDFRKSLEGTTLAELISALADRHTRLVDAVLASYINEAGQPESRCYINLASFGLGGDVVKFVNERRVLFPKWVGGRTRFVLGALRALADYRCTRTEIVLDNERRITIETNLMVIANGKFAGGGMMLAPHAEIDDGWLDVTLSDGAGRFDVIKELRRIGHGGLLKNPKVSQARAKAVVVTSEKPLAIDIDGEMVGYTPATMKVLPGAVRFVSKQR